MPVKKHPRTRKTIRQKRLIHAIPIKDTSFSLDGDSPKGREAAIIKQFHQIQKGYTRLMNDVAKEVDLVKGWIGTQALIKKNELKNRFGSGLSKE